MTQQPNNPAPVEKAAPGITNDDIRREFLAAGFTIKDLRPHVYEAARRILALAAQQAAQPVAGEPVAGEPVMVEAVAEVVDTDDGLTLRWLIEGGIAAMADGCVLVMPHSPITGDDGSGEVYTATPAPVGLVPLTEAQLVECLVAAGCIGTVRMSYDSGPYEITHTSINADRLASAIEAKLCEVNGIKAGKDVAK